MVMNPLSRKAQKNPEGASASNFRASHTGGKNIQAAVAPQNAMAKNFAAKKQAVAAGKSIFGNAASDASAQNTAAQKKNTAAIEALQRARISKEAADFLARQKAQREKTERIREKANCERELHDIEQHKFLFEQKIRQLESDCRRNQMEKMHTAGLGRRYGTEVNQYKTEIVKYENMVNEFKKELRRNPRNMELVKKIQLAEGNIRRIKNLSHGVEVKVQMQEETGDERERRIKAYERDIQRFRLQLLELESRAHVLQQQIRYLNV